MPTLTNDAVLAASDLLGVQTLPLVLNLAPQQDTIEAFTAAREFALHGLRSGGLVDRHDDLDADLAVALRILAQPERELAARIHTESGTRRVCLVRKGTQHALAVRTGDAVELRSVWADNDGAALAKPLLDALGPCAPATIAQFSAPARELAEQFDAATDSSSYTQAVYNLGMDERDAIEFGMAVAQCHTHAEIVAYTHDDGVTTRTSGAVAVYDTARGRIIASPGAAPDQQIWTTFTPGSDHRLAQAISALVETLPGGRWMP